MQKAEPKGLNRNIWFRDPAVLDGAARISRSQHRSINWVLARMLENEIARYVKDPNRLESRRPNF